MAGGDKCMNQQINVPAAAPTLLSSADLTLRQPEVTEDVVLRSLDLVLYKLDNLHRNNAQAARLE